MCFLMEKTHACSQGIILEDYTVLTVCEIRSVPLGEVRIIPEEKRKEIGAWRAERKAGEKPRLSVSMCEDCTES